MLLVPRDHRTQGAIAWQEGVADTVADQLGSGVLSGRRARGAGRSAPREAGQSAQDHPHDEEKSDDSEQKGEDAQDHRSGLTPSAFAAPAILSLRKLNDYSVGAETSQLIYNQDVIEIKKVLVPTDFSESARHAFQYAVSLAQRFGAGITLLHVVENVAVSYASDLFPVPMAEVFEEVSGYARKEIAALAAEVRAQGIEVRESVVQGKPPAEILRAAREEAIDLIVLGTHGRGVLDHALFGSTTERVVRKAPCPVLTCRPPEAATPKA